MQTIQIELDAHRCPIYIGYDLLAQGELWRSHIKAQQVLLITTASVAPHYAAIVKRQLENFQYDFLILPDGEEQKNLQMAEQIWDKLIEENYHRTATLIALGGGVIGDLTGFAAACYQRGVPFIQMPTTLLAQVDAAIGGKTAVNHAKGKNMIGAFHQPECVVIDIKTLSTLPKRHVHAGMAEIIKYGLIKDKDFFNDLVANSAKICAQEPMALEQAITRSCVIKADIVMNDEKEKSGLRALLNFGHTFGHAIETAVNYNDWLHGEAVAVGMLMAADLSMRMGYITAHEVERIKQLLVSLALPIFPPRTLTQEQFLETMRRDKKNSDEGLVLILLRQLGEAQLLSHVPEKLLRETLMAFEIEG